jgi:hypothetical protein
LVVELSILEERENSAESSPDTKLAVAENENRGKATKLNSQNCSQWAQEGPQAIAGERQVPKEGELTLQSRNGVAGDFLQFDDLYRPFALSRWTSRQEIIRISAARGGPYKTPCIRVRPRVQF